MALAALYPQKDSVQQNSIILAFKDPNPRFCNRLQPFTEFFHSGKEGKRREFLLRCQVSQQVINVTVTPKTPWRPASCVISEGYWWNSYGGIYCF